MSEEFNQSPDDLIRHVIEPTGVTLEDIEKGPVNVLPTPWIPFELKKFTTPSGRVEFFSTYLQNKGFEPLSTINPLWKRRGLTPHPLRSTRCNHNQVNSSFYQQKYLMEIWPTQVARIHPDDASARGIKDGAEVTVLNDRGEVEAKAEVTFGILPGVISLVTGWGAFNQKQTASNLTPEEVEPISLGQSLNSSMVDVVIRKGPSQS